MNTLDALAAHRRETGAVVSTDMRPLQRAGELGGVEWLDKRMQCVWHYAAHSCCSMLNSGQS